MAKGRSIIRMPRQAFQDAFQVASRAVSYKKGGGAENNVYIRTDSQEGIAFFYGTNLETAIRTQAECETSESHAVMFDQQLMNDLLTASDGQTVEITWNGRHNYAFVCGNTTAEFRTQDAEDFPMPRIKHVPVLSFTGEGFRKVARQIDVVNAGETGGFHLYKHTDDLLWFESYDTSGGFARARLGEYTVLNEDVTLDWVLLNKSVRVAAGVFGDKAETVRLLADKHGEYGTVVLQGEEIMVIVRLFNANWPAMYRVFDQPVPYWIEATKKEWTQGLQLMQLLSDTEMRGGSSSFFRYWLEMRSSDATIKTYNKGGKHDSERVIPVTASQLDEEQKYLLSAAYMLAAINTLRVNKVKVGFVLSQMGKIAGCAVWSDEDPRVEWRFPGYNPPEETKREKAS